MLEKYFQDIFNTFKAGDATEFSYYIHLQKLIEKWSQRTKKKLQITSQPKRIKAGMPDFRIRDHDKHLVGYIEAKDPKYDLDKLPPRDQDQIKRYKDELPNLITTNFFHFRFYRNGTYIDEVTIGQAFDMYQLNMVPKVKNEEKFFKLLEQFTAFSIPKTTTAKALAFELANRTRSLRNNMMVEELEAEESFGNLRIMEFYKAFKDHLIHDLSPAEFANLFAQTITYGLFAARSRATDSFNRELAYKYIPSTIGILRNLFKYISQEDLPKSMEWIIDEIAEVLAVADVKKIITDFYQEGKGDDPIVPFYEPFLAKYDPKEREKRGVYYTPKSVVKYIVHSIDHILKEEFNLEDGFATSSVTVLDPAAGTLTFIVEAIHRAINEYKEKYGDGNIKGLIKEHILKNFYAFELMMAPYAVGHLKIGFILDEYGYQMTDDERFNLYLTNTLDFIKEDPNKIPGIFEKIIAKESNSALEIKEQKPIMVIMGNPPYSGISTNIDEKILQLISDYKPKPIGEKKEKKLWIQDDYVKFFRFAQSKIEQNEFGILGFITNHSWLDNPTFRGMRYSLLNTFNEIYILNLHGSIMRREKTPDDGEDENVFDIRMGVAITIGIKHKDKNDNKVFYTDLWGLRDEKDNWLEKNNIKTTDWQILTPSDPYYFFIPRKEKGRKKYEKFLPMIEIFPVNITGIITARDEFVINFSKPALESKIRIFLDPKNSDAYIKEFLRDILNRKEIKDVENYAWRVSEAREQLRKDKDCESYFKKILYRPFDERWIFYHPSVVWRTRENVMKHLLHENLSLSLTKRHPTEDLYNEVFISDKLTEGHLLSGSLGISYIFPLYLYNNESKNLINESTKVNKKPNINDKLFKLLQNKLGKNFTPEEFFYYLYTILYSNIYRNKYQEFLKIDFPRIPFTKDYKLFQKLAELGEKLVDLHLLKSAKLINPIAKFCGQDSSSVQKRKYIEKEQRIYINDTQYFEGIKPEFWNYHIGGYQVLDKWLKDRKGRDLSSEDVKHYCRIVTALAETIEIQKEIDKLYPEVEKDLLPYKMN